MRSWFVLNTKPKKEHQVEKIFLEAGFHLYNPKLKVGDRISPFFPGYAFIEFDFPEQYRLVRYTRGVKRIVGNESGPIPIGEEVVQAIKAREVNGLIELEKYGKEPKVGDEIEVMEGPLKGLKGVFQKEISGKDRVLILMNYVSYQAKMIVEKKKLRRIL
jgi:transcriptional antiterminator RfaH